MANWKAIKKQAEVAKELCRDVTNIPTYFDPLLEEFPQDPMVYFIRGETFENFGMKEEACSDFSFALSNFPKDKWGKKAETAMKRVCKELD